MHRTRPLVARRSVRRPLALGALAACAVLTTACGSGATPTADAEASTDRTVDTAFGAVEVPADAERVVALGDTPLDTALALDVTPVGTLSSRGGTTVSAYLADRAGDVEIVGTVRETNLEAVVRAAPDLVLAAPGTPRAQYDLLSAIAPTVVPETPAFGDWERPALAYADALGRADEAQALLDELDARAAELEGRVDDPGTAVVARWMPNGPIVMSSSLMAGRLVEATGDELPAVADVTDAPHTDPLSLENLGAVDADVLYVATLNEDGEAALAAAQASPAFARLAAARAGRVHAVDGSTWTSAAGPVAAGLVLDDLERIRAAE